jgi:hypothetical protein
MLVVIRHGQSLWNPGAPHTCMDKNGDDFPSRLDGVLSIRIQILNDQSDPGSLQAVWTYL